MSQSTRSMSKLAQKATRDEREVEEALLERSHGASGVVDQFDATEDPAAP